LGGFSAQQLAAIAPRLAEALAALVDEVGEADSPALRRARAILAACLNEKAKKAR